MRVNILNHYYELDWILIEYFEVLNIKDDQYNWVKELSSVEFE